VEVVFAQDWQCAREASERGEVLAGEVVTNSVLRREVGVMIMIVSAVQLCQAVFHGLAFWCGRLQAHLISSMRVIIFLVFLQSRGERCDCAVSCFGVFLDSTNPRFARQSFEALHAASRIG